MRRDEKRKKKPEYLLLYFARKIADQMTKSKDPKNHAKYAAKSMPATSKNPPAGKAMDAAVRNGSLSVLARS
ncbi:MAG: hypothetical protein QXZ71_05155, partial [Candidatus Caldarchaeum sp.]